MEFNELWFSIGVGKRRYLKAQEGSRGMNK
jgi:hypothetical protein